MLLVHLYIIFGGMSKSFANFLVELIFKELYVLFGSKGKKTK